MLGLGFTLFLLSIRSINVLLFSIKSFVFSIFPNCDHRMFCELLHCKKMVLKLDCKCLGKGQDHNTRSDHKLLLDRQILGNTRNRKPESYLIVLSELLYRIANLIHLIIHQLEKYWRMFNKPYHSLCSICRGEFFFHAR